MKTISKTINPSEWKEGEAIAFIQKQDEKPIKVKVTWNGEPIDCTTKKSDDYFHVESCK